MSEITQKIKVNHTYNISKKSKKFIKFITKNPTFYLLNK